MKSVHDIMYAHMYALADVWWSFFLICTVINNSHWIIIAFLLLLKSNYLSFLSVIGN